MKIRFSSSIDGIDRPPKFTHNVHLIDAIIIAYYTMKVGSINCPKPY